MTELDERPAASDFSSDFQAESRKETSATILRMIQAIRGNGHDDLASFLGISKDAIYKAERQAKIPPHWFIVIGKRIGISIDWLVTGSGCTHPGEADVAPAEMQMEPARAGVMRAGDRLATPVIQPEAYANVLSAQAEEIAVLRQENRELRQENRELLKENADLRVTVAEMRARAAPERDASKEMPEEEARKSA